ncbi:MAG: hypothetical protein EOP94_02845 [Zymomonas sp.]|nr:MAG: hypothetical protein EOP94_02845 [Zymomonas sp.]
MSLRFDLLTLVKELDRTHGESFSLAGSGIPAFVTARSGPQRFFTAAASSMLRTVAATMFQNRSASAIRVEIAAFTSVVTQVVADLHAEGAFAEVGQDPDSRALGVLKAEVESRLEQAGEVYTHHFPAWTQGFERLAPIHLGPVRFARREDWLAAVDFPENAKNDYLNEAAANHRWKEIVLDALGKPQSEVELRGLAGPVYDVIRRCPGVLSVTIRGFEQHFSRKLGRIVSKAALDATSLFFQNSELFRQQTLHDERLPPIASSSGFIESNGYLWLPGSKLNRHPVMPYDVARSVWDGMAEFHAPVGEILRALVEPSSHPHPRLASRWATALDWLAEGCREVSDAVALAKVGTSLDVLSAGGKYRGILSMVAHLTGLNEEAQVMKAGEPMTLAQVIKAIYDQGRSQILHGTHHDRLKSFVRERAQAEQIASSVLLAAALRLHVYKGDDDDKAFSTMPRPNDAPTH